MARKHVTREEYRETLLPPMRAAAEAGDVRMVFVGIGHPHAWKRTAIVTDVDWVTKTIHMFAWPVPGEIMVRGLDGLEEAKAWVAG